MLRILSNEYCKMTPLLSNSSGDMKNIKIRRWLKMRQAWVSVGWHPPEKDK